MAGLGAGPRCALAQTTPDGGAPAPSAPAPSQAAPTQAAPAPQTAPATEPQKIARIHFHGNRKVEDEAIRVNLASQVGEPFLAAKLREDVKNIWKMGFFDDVKVDVADAKQGVVLVYDVKE